jgi:hypothetical protein
MLDEDINRCGKWWFEQVVARRGKQKIAAVERIKGIDGEKRRAVTADTVPGKFRSRRVG